MKRADLELKTPWMRVPRIIREHEAEGYKLTRRERLKGGKVRLEFEEVKGDEH